MLYSVINLWALSVFFIQNIERKTKTNEKRFKLWFVIFVAFRNFSTREKHFTSQPKNINTNAPLKKFPTCVLVLLILNQNIWCSKLRNYDKSCFWIHKKTLKIILVRSSLKYMQKSQFHSLMMLIFTIAIRKIFKKNLRLIIQMLMSVDY
jgi:hypothetical protein